MSDPGTLEDSSLSKRINCAGSYEDSCIAHDSTLARLYSASQTTHTDMATEIGISFPIPGANSSYEEHKRDHPQDKEARSLYTRLISIFQHKDRKFTVLTPPASPKTFNLDAPPPPSPPLEQLHSVLSCEPLVQADSDNTLLHSWTPMTPDSVEHHYAGRSDIWPELICVPQELALNEGREGVCNMDSEDTPAPCVVDMAMNNGVEDVGDLQAGLGASHGEHLGSRINPAPGLVSHPKNQKEDGYANYAEGIQLGRA